MRPRTVLLALIAVLCVTQPASAGPVTQEPCPGAALPEVFSQGHGKLENLLFDGAGHLYTTSIEGELRRFAPDGSSELIVQAPRELGGLAIGPDGALYAGHGVPLGPHEIAGVAIAPADAEVWRFASLDPLQHAVYASGFTSANGLAFDGAGNLYVAPGFDRWIERVTPDGTRTRWADAHSANGLFTDATGSSLLASLTSDQASRIIRIPAADPTAIETVASLSFGVVTAEPAVHAPSAATLPVVPKGLDDIGVAPDGTVYATGHITGELLRVNPQTGAACVLASRLQEPSSVRVARGFGAFDGRVFVTEFGGRILVMP